MIDTSTNKNLSSNNSNILDDRVRYQSIELITS